MVLVKLPALVAVSLLSLSLPTHYAVADDLDASPVFFADYNLMKPKYKVIDAYSIGEGSSMECCCKLKDLDTGEEIKKCDANNFVRKPNGDKVCTSRKNRCEKRYN